MDKRLEEIYHRANEWGENFSIKIQELYPNGITTVELLVLIDSDPEYHKLSKELEEFSRDDLFTLFGQSMIDNPNVNTDQVDGVMDLIDGLLPGDEEI